MGVRITKLRCPSCDGSGSGIVGTCMWCHGEKRLPTQVALRYADTVHMIAGGGYICGDHDYADMRKMEAEAEHIYAVAQVTPKWKQPKDPR